ncbi:hypothetical protein H6F90_19820 [Trichocoleus sp. FACHB-591]|uniref:hypothetical protein n=1 Tax=Trichocoleus sp. FACHB-591 TaxID=2692872 RepID=UPI001684C46B|nr:hypothetical protein [Trichocoleus sp. FACHB-591]MBD2097351.1 hypothetical protein [Trichocoleus sp. FACHB-591]
MLKCLNLATSLSAIALLACPEAASGRSLFENTEYPLEPANLASLTCYAQTEAGQIVNLTQLCAQSQSQADCSPAYPDICLSPKLSSLTCNDIPHRNFRVLSPDPYGLDPNNNRIGCEPLIGQSPVRYHWWPGK